VGIENVIVVEIGKVTTADQLRSKVAPRQHGSQIVRPQKDGLEMTFKRRIWLTALAVVSGAMLTVMIVGSAAASPSTVTLVANTCYGQGQSSLSYPAGYAHTTGCGLSSQYISATACFSGGGCSTLAGAWSSTDQYWVNSGTGPSGPVTTVAATHNLQYIIAQSGYQSTNTW